MSDLVCRHRKNNSFTKPSAGVLLSQFIRNKIMLLLTDELLSTDLQLAVIINSSALKKGDKMPFFE